MDLTQFMHGGPAEILACSLCGMIRRHEEYAADYESDRSHTALMKHLYPRYRDAFAQKRHRFRHLLPPGAIRTFAASLLTPPYPDMSGSWRHEWYQTRRTTEHRGAANGPWIEIPGRAVEPSIS